MVTRRQLRELAQLQQRRQPPDLQALVLAHGTWDKITPGAWVTFDREMAQWKLRMRVEGSLGTWPEQPHGRGAGGRRRD